MEGGTRATAGPRRRQRHVIVVGGGISGLAAAERLARERVPARVTLLEASDALGGCIGTDHVDGFVVERGPDVFLAKPAALELCARVGIADRLIATRPEAPGSYVMRGGTLRRDPGGSRPIYSGTAQPTGGPPPVFRSLRGGLGTLIAGVAGAIRARGVDVRTGVHVRHVVPRPGSPPGTARQGARVVMDGGDVAEADAVIVATSARAAAALLGDADPGLGAELSAVAHASLAIVTLGYGPVDTARVLDATGYTVPPDEHRPAIACTWSSAKLDGRAPEHHSLFRVFFGGAALEREDAAFIALARAELCEVLGIGDAPRMTHVVRWTSAMPRYAPDHSERVARMDARVRALAGIVLAGNSYLGVGIPDCVRSGELAAARALGML